ncbi:MAG TPA: methyltransferase [Kofleriaceae bacterium]|nr:methyltransferase [Kofleriaceae bacterium]
MEAHQLPPQAIMMQLLLGRFVSQAIGAAATLRLADHLGDGPRSATDLAAATGAHAPSVHRLLRALASVGVFVERDPGTFANTPLSETLRDRPGSVLPQALFFNHPVHLKAWTAIDQSVATGSCGFEHAFGMTPWAYLGDHRDVAAVFNQAMTSISSMFAPAVAAAYDFRGLETLVDVGGGHGLLLTTILRANPSLRGVLFDLPQVVAGAQAGDVADRLTITGGDFFAEVPAADAYVMKHILHDWSDDRAAAILRTIHRSARPGARLLVVESVLKPGNAPDLGKLIDLEMLVFTEGGRERDEAEFRALFASAGFALQRVVPTMSPVSVLEAIRT